MLTAPRCESAQSCNRIANTQVVGMAAGTIVIKVLMYVQSEIVFWISYIQHVRVERNKIDRVSPIG